MSRLRFSMSDVYESRARGSAISVSPSAEWKWDSGGIPSNSRGTMSICTSSVSSSRIVSSVVSCESPENATITRSTSSSSTQQGDVRHAADDGEVADVRPPLGRVVVDESDDVEAVLRMLEELLRDQLADAACSDDQRVLDVRRCPSNDRAGHDAATGDEHDRRHPECEELAEVWFGHMREPGAGNEDPGAEGDHVENTPRVIDRGIVGLLLVAVVEPVRAGEQHPDRQRRDEDERLLQETDRDPPPQGCRR